jgi:hypothetical protein
MKKVLYAWIEQIVQFDSEQERQKFIDGIKGVQVIDSSESDGNFTVHVKRPYNNNQMK